MKESINSINSQKTIPFKSSLNKRLILILFLTGIVLGALQTWDSRHVMNADGISYLDIGDAYMRGDLKTAINAFWPPLYSWLLGLTMSALKPSAYYEFTVVHLLNFIIYLCTLGCFHFFLMQFIRYHRFLLGKTSGNRIASFPGWAWIALGYTLFFRASLNMITISSVTPDMCVAAFSYLASGILLRIYMGSSSYPTFVLLGIVLGFGYLAKSVMFPLAFIFLSASMFSIGNLRRALPRVMIALIVFFSIVSPFIVTISNVKDRITFGDSGKYNYWLGLFDHKGARHWSGEPSGSGTPIHPPRKIFNSPTIYEFGTPIGGTYPIWYDPSYWYDGIATPFDLKRQLTTLKLTIKDLFDIIYPSHSILIFGSFLLYLMSGRRWSVVKDVAEHWLLLVPVIAALGLYGLVSVNPRYTGPFIPLLWLGVFSGIRLPDSEESRRLLRHVTIVMVLVMMIITGRNMIKEKYPSLHIQWQVADSLNQMGLLPGNKAASIGVSHSHYWARLAKVRIVAEMPRLEEDYFWEADNTVQAKVFETFRKTGAKAIVTKYVPGNIAPVGWQRVAQSDYYVYMLNK